ncbi:MAG: GNAT family N-acetyltransferase [Rhodospirillaceae bacterium]|nr:GNAT family N-acetyltransferase [Rhodospirillales bacterium]
MLRETAKAANEADQFLADVINNADLAALNRNDGQVPESLVAFLTQALQAEDNLHQWHEFGRTLGSNGLVLAALAAFNRAIKETSVAIQKVPVYADQVAVERSLGLTCAAAADQRVLRRLAGEPALPESMPDIAEGELSVVCVRSDAALYGQLLDGFTCSPLLNDPLRNPRLTKDMFLDPTYVGTTGSVEDFSFFVVDEGGRPIVQCECDVMGDRYMGCREAGIVLTDCVVASPLLEAAQELALKQLFLMAEWAGCSQVLMEVSNEVAPCPPLQACLLQRKGNRGEVLNAWIDLSQSPEEIERGYRDAHRQSLRWGRKHVTVLSTIAGLSTEQAMEAYLAVHAKARRNPGLRRERLEQLLTDGAHVTVYAGIFEGEPSSVLVSSRHGTTTYYMAAAKADVGNKPLSHVLLHQAVLDAKAEGQKRFDFGVLHSDERWSAKLRNISLYKRGYTRSLERRSLLWLPV